MIILAKGGSGKELLKLYLHFLQFTIHRDYHPLKTYSSKTVLVKAGISHKALGFSNALTVILVGSHMVACIKLFGTCERIGSDYETEEE